jgi:hypothetical protein
MEIGEIVAVGFLKDSFDESCPFKEDALGADDYEAENILKDDTKDAEKQQDNDGGVLGRNLASGSQGKGGTVGGPFSLEKASGVKRTDTARGGVKVIVGGTDTTPRGEYGFTVAAHHLIPGEASLAPSYLKKFMTKEDSVTVWTEDGTKTKTIAKHIGYNVNGAHNGVWLPGNYFIREETSPIPGKSWSDLENDPWCLNYVAAVAKAAGGQMHDAHTQYNSAVKDLLNKIALVLVRHECKDCKTDKINPPFRIKERLYNLSNYFRGQVTSLPFAWKRPWFTSDRWRNDAFSGGKPSNKFIDAYQDAQVVTN